MVIYACVTILVNMLNLFKCQPLAVEIAYINRRSWTSLLNKESPGYETKDYIVTSHA